MSRRHGGWAPYVPVAERRRKAEREMANRQKQGQAVAPVTITGRAIASTFWGKAWCENLESYHDYENRLPRGRAYVRNGSVIDLQISPLTITALVSGSSIYRVSVAISAVPPGRWQAICLDCAGGIASLVELLQGRLSKPVMERLCRQDHGLFPKPSEIRFSCSCPDAASMCKHVAAALYGVGARLDQQPELLFRLRAVNEQDLIADLDRALPLSKAAPAADRLLVTDDLSALFGLDLAGGEDAVVPATAGPPPSAGPKPETRNAGEPKTSAPARSPRSARKTTSSGNAGQSSNPIEPAVKDSRPPNQGTTKSARPDSSRQPTRRKRGAIWDPSDIYNQS